MSSCVAVDMLQVHRPSGTHGRLNVWIVHGQDVSTAARPRSPTRPSTVYTLGRFGVHLRQVLRDLDVRAGS